MSKKRGREDGDLDIQLVEIYEDLASENEHVRVKSIRTLVSKLSSQQDLKKKVLIRLFRGLASGRKSARVGFSIALAEVLRLYAKLDLAELENGVEIPEAIDLLESSTKISKDVKGQESRDHYFGKLFGAAALIQSGILFLEPTAHENWIRILKFIFDAAQTKIWLREECGWVLYQAVKSLKNAPSGHLFVGHLVGLLSEKAWVKTPEGIAIWIAVNQWFPQISMPRTVYHHEDPLSRKEKATLARILRQSSTPLENESDQNGSLNTKFSGTWFSKLHFAWDIALSAARIPGKNRITFAELWREAIDDGLFSSKASPERNYWGFLLFQRHIMSALRTDIPSLFGPNLARCLKRELTSEEKYLNVMAMDVIDAIVARSIEDPDSIPELVAGFLAADLNFDRIAQNKPIEKLVGQANLNSLERILQLVTHEIDQLFENHPAEHQHSLTSLADILVAILRTHGFPDSDSNLTRYRSLVDAILRVLVHHTYMSKSTGAIQDMFRQRLMSSLNIITAKDVNPAYHPCATVIMIRLSVEKDYLDAEPEVLKAIEKGVELLEKLKSKSEGQESTRKNTFQAFELLLAFALLQAYAGEEESINTIDDLLGCYKSLVKRKTTASDGEDVVALIEIIVEFVSKPSALYRRLAPQILSAFSSRVNEEGLQVMLNVLTTTENSSGQAELFANGDEDIMNAASGSDPSAESDSEDSDVEVLDADAEDGDSTSSSDSGSSRSTSNGAPDHDEELAAFDAQLAAALGTQRMAGNDESDVDSDSDMSDAQMEALDAQLGQIFRQRLQGSSTTAKQQRRGARDNIVHFKTKILELLEAYVKREFRNPTALHLICPLLQSMHATSNRLVTERTCDLIRLFSRLYKLRLADPADREKAGFTEEQASLRLVSLQSLTEIHALVHKSISQLQAKACSSAALLATKAYLSNGGQLQPVVDLYEQTRESLKADREAKFRQCFWDDWVNWRVQADKTGQLSSL